MNNSKIRVWRTPKLETESSGCCSMIFNLPKRLKSIFSGNVVKSRNLDVEPSWMEITWQELRVGDIVHMTEVTEFILNGEIGGLNIDYLFHFRAQVVQLIFFC